MLLFKYLILQFAVTTKTLHYPMTLSASHLGWGLGASDVRNFTHVSDSTIKDFVSD